MGNLGTGFGNQGGGGGGFAPEIIEVTKADFLSLVGADGLTFPATYKITDVDGFTGIFVNSTSANTFDTNAGGNLLAPDYVAGGINLGQMNPIDIPTVADGEKVIWADHYWLNNSGGSVVPTIVDDFTLDAPMAQLTKSVANGYDVIQVSLTIDGDLEISTIYNPLYASKFTIPSSISTVFEFTSYIYTPINQIFNSSDNIISTLNNYIPENKVVSVRNTFEDFGIVKNNAAALSGIIIEGSGNEVSGNKSTGKYGFNTIKLVNSSRFQNNETVSTGGEGASIGYVELFDNCEVIGNYLEGDGAVMWDIRTGESSRINNNSVVGTNSGWSDIDQMNNDYVENNTITGDNINIAILDMLGKSVFSNNTFTQNNFQAERFELLNSEISNCTVSSGVSSWESLWMTNSSITNATNIALKQLNLTGVDLNLTGFTTDIISETIENGKGWFTITHDFDANPLTSGTSVEYNLIPLSARILSINAIGLISGGVGAVLSMGLETDDNSLISDTVGNYSTGKSYSGFSAQATANRSLQLSASVNNITSGTITVKVEFMI
jgi:hypothetical protein